MCLEIKDLREIAAAMIQLYPAMFLNSRSGDVGGEGDLNIDLGLSFSTCIFLLGLAGYGDTGGGLNLNGLAQKMSYRVNIRNLLQNGERILYAFAFILQMLRGIEIIHQFNLLKSAYLFVVP